MPDIATVLITGANRGLGLEFVRQYAADGWRVIAACRRPDDAAALRAVTGHVTVHRLDVDDPASALELARSLGDTAIDLLINNAGIYGHGQTLGRIDYAGWQAVLRTNVLGPIVVTEALLANLCRAKDARVVLMTSLMGSIADNTSGGIYAYRASKAALNASGRSLALDLRDRGIVVVMLHPGWVQTDMGGTHAPLKAAQSVGGLRRVMARVGMAESGGYYDFRGHQLPW